MGYTIEKLLNSNVVIKKNGTDIDVSLPSSAKLEFSNSGDTITAFSGKQAFYGFTLAEIDAMEIEGFAGGIPMPATVAELMNALANFYFFEANPSPNDPLEISKGNVLGTSGLTKFGENPDISSGGAFAAIWDFGGPYVPPTEARPHDVASTLATDAGTLVSSGNATGGSITTLVDAGADFVADGVAVGDYLLNDSNSELGIIAVVTETTLTLLGNIFLPITGFAGMPIAPGDAYRVVTNASTGASIWYQLGQSGSRIEQDEFIILNGTTPVASALSYARQYRARVFAPNTAGALGVITSTAQIDNTVSCQVINGNNQTLMAVYAVPFDMNGYITKWWGSLSKKSSAVSTLKLRSGSINPDGVGYVLQDTAIVSVGSSRFSYGYPNPRPIPGGADIWVEADTDTPNTGISSGFEMTLVAKSLS